MMYAYHVARGLLAASAAMLAACVPLPHTHTQEPAAAFSLRDSVGHIAIGGRVHLYAAIVLDQGVRFADSATVDDHGIAAFQRRREWHTFLFLVPDGEAPWVWGWCAEAPGMTAEFGRFDEPPDDTVRVRFRAAANVSASHCPHQPHSLYDLPVQRSGAAQHS